MVPPQNVEFENISFWLFFVLQGRQYMSMKLKFGTVEHTTGLLLYAILALVRWSFIVERAWVERPDIKIWFNLRFFSGFSSHRGDSIHR